MKTRWEISAAQAGLLAAGAVAMTGHALAATQFIAAGGRDAWLGGLAALPFGLLAVWSLYRLGQRFPGQTLTEYLPQLLGYAGYVVGAVYIAYFYLAAIFTLRNTTDWLVDSILPETPSWVTGGLYLAAVLYSARGGLDVLARVNQFTLALVTAFGIFVSIGTGHGKDYGLLLPVLQHGFGPLLAVTLLEVGYLGELSILAQFHPYVVREERAKAWRWYVAALLFAVVTSVGPVAGAIATFGYRTAQNMTHPTFKQWLMVSFARFFERTDLMAVHQWLAGTYVREALFLLLASHGLVQFSRRRIQLVRVLPIASLGIWLTAELAFPNKPILDAFLIGVYLPLSAVLGSFLPPLLLLIAVLRRAGTAP
ncbi:MAG TPA: endospore germination permease [Symbiobacteriaceae bacterium]|nr:endospore germination permease [Symbiobacteriaceae bacterium]